MTAIVLKYRLNHTANKDEDFQQEAKALMQTITAQPSGPATRSMDMTPAGTRRSPTAWRRCGMCVPMQASLASRHRVLRDQLFFWYIMEIDDNQNDGAAALAGSLADGQVCQIRIEAPAVC